jgi:hypothetical protein
VYVCLVEQMKCVGKRERGFLCEYNKTYKATIKRKEKKRHDTNYLSFIMPLFSCLALLFLRLCLVHVKDRQTLLLLVAVVVARTHTQNHDDDGTHIHPQTYNAHSSLHSPSPPPSPQEDNANSCLPLPPSPCGPWTPFSSPPLLPIIISLHTQHIPTVAKDNGQQSHHPPPSRGADAQNLHTCRTARLGNTLPTTTQEQQQWQKGQ